MFGQPLDNFGMRGGDVLLLSGVACQVVELPGRVVCSESSNSAANS